MISIIDYGAGNLYSVKNALDYLNIDSVITNDKKVISNSKKIIIPGVGAFPAAMDMLVNLDLVDFLKNQAKEKYIFGICLGMQILFDSSDEITKTNGLGLIPGQINKINAPNLKIPHMGWNNLIIQNETPLINGLEENSFVYFVHSFKAETENKHICTYSEYGEKIPGIVFNENIFGAQFHPEKSGKTGLKIIENFANMK